MPQHPPPQLRYNLSNSYRASTHVGYPKVVGLVDSYYAFRVLLYVTSSHTQSCDYGVGLNSPLTPLLDKLRLKSKNDKEKAKL